MTGELAILLGNKRNQILARFVAEVEHKDIAPPNVAQSQLVDHLPGFLDQVIGELARIDEVQFHHDVFDSSETARQHGGQRWLLGYDLEGLIREYGVLRHAILQTAKESDVRVSIDEFDILAKCINVGVAEAASAYVIHRDEQLDVQRGNLEFLAEAGQLLASSLDYRSTLARLTQLIVPRLADWCAVHIDGGSIETMPIAHVDPEKIEAIRELYRSSPASDALRGYQYVMRTGEAQLVSAHEPGSIDSLGESADYRELVHEINLSSWMIVPLRIQNTILGALTLAYSDSQRHYGTSDLVLARDLARRASVAIDNARLYELSQRERSRVEAATRAKDEFVAMISHELRTPLNAILGWIRLLRGGILPTERREHALEVIERNAVVQNQLVADLLDISRIVTGKIKISPTQVDIGSVVEMAIDGVRLAAEAKHIQIEKVRHEGDTVVRADGDRIQQVVWNLLSNAIKFTSKNGRVRVYVRRTDADIEIVVADNGEGIAPEFLPHVFETFRQSGVGYTRSHGGLGIGLSISKHIVELHGGVIEPHSEGIGRGATFIVRLPVSPVVPTTFDVANVPAIHREPASVAIPTAVAGLRVLVVDDEVDARDLIAYVLDAAGIEVRTTASMAEALGELRSYSPHVIISDIAMPEEDGYALIRSVRTFSILERRNIPAIALTAFARSEDRTRALVEGFNLHMSKPVEPAMLVRAVIDLAGQSAG